VRLPFDIPRSVRTAALLAVALAVFLVLAPTACGGAVTYARVGGASMAPQLLHGDVVLARRAASYAPGDVVAYRHPELGLLMHRIVAVEGGRYMLRGDANGWTDSFRPTSEQIAGRLWLRVPRVGLALDALRPPWGPVLLVLLAAGGAIAPLLRARRRPRRRVPRRVSGPRLAPLTLYAAPGSLLAIGSLLVVAGGIGAGVYGYGRPQQEPAAFEVSYEQRGHFGYGAPAPGGIYDGDTIAPGQPLFVKLTGTMDVSFAYELDTALAGTVAGTGQLDAYLTQSNGWQRTIPLAAEAPFEGSGTTLRGTIDLTQLKRLIDRVEAATDADYEQYRIVLAARVQAQVTEAGAAPQPLPLFAPRLVFRFSSKELQLDDQVGDNGLQRAASGGFPQSTLRPARSSLLGQTVSVAALRLWALPLAAAGAAVFAALAWRTRRAFGGGEQQRIEAQYGALITTAHLVHPATERPLISVARFADLAAIAVRNNLPVIRDALDLRQYVVVCAEATYHFRAAGDGEPAAAPRAA
jgi:signal peptidase